MSARSFCRLLGRRAASWAAQTLLTTSAAGSKERQAVVATRFDQLAKSKDSRLRFEPLDAAERQKLAQRGQEVQGLREERRKLETAAGVKPAEKPSKEFVPVKVKRPRSPFMAQPVAELGQEDAPPKIYDAPQPDLKVAPKPRGESRVKSHDESKGDYRGEAKGNSRGEAKGRSKK